ncbi:MAG: hypothetical protein LBM78_04780 [Clostridiales bacterium]|nr:hypothetical protein [Clostridiales bacterium]
MTEILKIIGIGLVTAVGYALLREQKPELAFLLAAAGGVLLLITVVDALVEVVFSLSAIASKTGLDGSVISSVLKIIGIGYLTEFAASLCEDMGVKNLSDKIATGGKIIVLFISLPIFTALINLIIGILP